MVSDAEQFKAQDEKQKERISAKNNLESYCFNMKSTVEDEKFKNLFFNRWSFKVSMPRYIDKNILKIPKTKVTWKQLLHVAVSGKNVVQDRH